MAKTSFAEYLDRVVASYQNNEKAPSGSEIESRAQEMFKLNQDPQATEESVDAPASADPSPRRRNKKRTKRGKKSFFRLPVV